MRWALVVAVVLAGCGTDVDEPWKLDHDRIVAVRATPPRILSGEQSTLDVLLSFKDQPVAEGVPDVAAVVSPESLKGALALDNGQWVVTAPSEDAIAIAREELHLPAGAAVPLTIGLQVRWPYPVTSPDGVSFTATKTVWLGESAQNPPLDGMLIAGTDAPAGTDLVVPPDEKVPLFVQADDTIDMVTWLTSCGEMHDFDLHSAYLMVPPDSSQQGQLAVVRRDDRGGVTWRVWPIRAE
ncbi:MAG: hypothetical protein HOV81_14345 [Kofleriaceae bacterium]|nr:hypothetical protein [Kofleriaceae bacterium]